MVTKVTDELLADTLDLSGKTVTMPAANTPALVNAFVSEEQTVTTNSRVEVEHGLGAIPKIYRCVLRCKIADLGWAVGDEIPLESTTYQGTAVRNGFLFANSTHIGIVLANADIGILNKTTYATGTITTANWRLVFYAWR